MGSPAVRQIEVVSGRALAGLETTWRRLLEADPVATVFQTWEWNAAWWHVFGRGRRLIAMVAHGADRPLALAPLALRRGPGGLFSRVEFLGTGVSDYLGFIGPSETMAECATAFLDTLSKGREGDLVDLQQLNPAHLGRCGWSSTASPGSTSVVAVALPTVPSRHSPSSRPSACRSSLSVAIAFPIPYCMGAVREPPPCPCYTPLASR